MMQEEFVKKAKKYEELRWKIKHKFNVQKSRQVLPAIRKELQEAALKMPLKDVVENMADKVRPLLAGMSLTSQNKYELSLLILKGTSVGILVKGKAKKPAKNKESEGRKISFEILQDIQSGKFELYPIYKGCKPNLTEHLRYEIKSYDVEYLIDFTSDGAMLFSLKKMESTMIKVCYWQLFPWMHIHI